MSGGGADRISGVHADVIGGHILPRLDGVSLAALSCVSSHFRSVAAADEDRLWRHVCASTWPSTTDPRVEHAISSLPGCHRGFFAGSFPLLTGHVKSNPKRSPPLTELISAVDIHYKNQPIFSRVQETETVSGWFEHSPFRVDLLGPKESIRVGPENGPSNLECELAENMRLSWIVMGPARKAWANISSGRAVGTERHWLTGEVTVKYSTVVRGVGVEVEVKVGVTCGGGEVHVREVGMRVEDEEGKWMNGRESVGVLGEVMEGGERRIERLGMGGESGRDKYGEYVKRRREWREEKDRRERKVGMAWIGVCLCVFLGFCMGCVLPR